MKKCPFCKADIEDSARFCLYCMKPLNEKEVIPPQQKKKSWWLPVVGAVLLLLVVFLLIGRGQSEPTGSSESSFSVSNTAQAPQGTEHTPSEDSGTQNTQQVTRPNQTPEQTPNNESFEPSENTPPVTTPDKPTDSEEPAEPEKPAQPIIYIYRAAHIGDDRTGQTVDPENDIVITGVKTPADDGIYHIPSYIDGKRVIAIEPAFNSYMYVKEVYLGETIRNVDSNAFVACYNLEKFYVACDKIFLSRGAFTDASRRNCTLTIYSSAQCLCLDELSSGYLKNEASKFRAQWEEWDGSQ